MIKTNDKYFNKTFKIGDKVAIPKTKSIGISLDKSLSIKNALNDNKDYLIVNGKVDNKKYFCTYDGVTSDLFLVQDLQPYNTSSLLLDIKQIKNKTYVSTKDLKTNTIIPTTYSSCSIEDENDLNTGIVLAFARSLGVSLKELATTIMPLPTLKEVKTEDLLKELNTRKVDFSTLLSNKNLIQIVKQRLINSL